VRDLIACGAPQGPQFSRGLRREAGPIDMDRSELPSVLCIFEDERYPNFLPLSLNRPVFDLTIGTQSLRGRLIEELGPISLVLFCRPYLAAVLAEEEPRDASREVRVNNLPDGEILFLNGRLLAYGEELGDLCADLKKDSVLQKKGILVAGRLAEEQAASFAKYIAASLTDEKVEKAIHEIKRASTGEIKKVPAGEEDGKDASRSRALGRWAQQNGVKLNETNVRLLSHYWQLIEENRNCIIDDFKKNPLRGTAPETHPLLRRRSSPLRFLRL
jgi:hypothetical protein